MHPDAQRRSTSQHSSNRQAKWSGYRASEEIQIPSVSLQEVVPMQQPQPVQQSSGGFCSTIVVIISWLLIICCFPWSLFIIIKVVNEYERVVVLRLGKLMRKQPLSAGLHVIIPCLDSVRKVDMRVRSFCVPLTDLITADSMLIRVETIVYYRVHDPVLVTTNVEDADKSTREASVTVCRNAIGTKPLELILNARNELCAEMETELSRVTVDWGIAIQRVELNDVQLSDELHRAMSLEKEARQNVRVKLIAAEGESAIASALSTAADKLARTPMALQLRYLQTLQSLTTAGNNINTVLVPLPLELGKLLPFALPNGLPSEMPDFTPPSPPADRPDELVMQPALSPVPPKTPTLTVSASIGNFAGSPGSGLRGERAHTFTTQSTWPDR